MSMDGTPRGSRGDAARVLTIDLQELAWALNCQVGVDRVHGRFPQGQQCARPVPRESRPSGEGPGPCARRHRSGLEKHTTKASTARHVLLNRRARAALLRQRALTPLAGDFVFLDPRQDKAQTEARAFRRSDWATWSCAPRVSFPAP
jgi:hypothetical protein